MVFESQTTTLKFRENRRLDPQCLVWIKFNSQNRLLIPDNPRIWNFNLMGFSWHFRPNRRADSEYIILTNFHVRNQLIMYLKSLYNLFQGQNTFFFQKNRCVDPHSHIGKIFYIHIHAPEAQKPPGDAFYQIILKLIFFWPHASTALRENLSYFVFQKTSSTYSKTPIYLFSDVRSVHELIGTKSESGAPKSGIAWRGVFRVLNPCF